MQSVKEFIERYICKAGETTEQLSENEWEIQKWTARTFKTMGNILIAGEYGVHPTQTKIPTIYNEPGKYLVMDAIFYWED